MLIFLIDQIFHQLDYSLQKKKEANEYLIKD